MIGRCCTHAMYPLIVAHRRTDTLLSHSAQARLHQPVSVLLMHACVQQCARAYVRTSPPYQMSPCRFPYTSQTQGGVCAREPGQDTGVDRPRPSRIHPGAAAHHARSAHCRPCQRHQARRQDPRQGAEVTCPVICVAHWPIHCVLTLCRAPIFCASPSTSRSCAHPSTFPCAHHAPSADSPSTPHHRIRAAIAAIEAKGGKIECAYYNPLALRALLKVVVLLLLRTATHPCSRRSSRRSLGVPCQSRATWHGTRVLRTEGMVVVVVMCAHVMQIPRKRQAPSVVCLCRIPDCYAHPANNFLETELFWSRR